MITEYLRKVVDRLSQLPAPVQDQVAAEIEGDLDQRERSAALAHQETPEVVYDPTTDPLAPFIGALHSGTPDLAERHDSYLAEAYEDDHAG
ncbi:MAG: hypothetical protein ACRDID_00935 [Ktedonobacterales bacterium]